MKIRSTLKITSIVSIVTLAALLPGMLWSFQSLRRASTFELFLIDLQRNIFERDLLRSEYLLLLNPRVAEQWRQKTAEVEGHLGVLSREALDPAQRELADRTSRSFRASMALFPQVSGFRKSREGDVRLSAGTMELGRRLTGQLFVNSYLLSNSVNLLLLDARHDTDQARDRMALLLGLFTLALALTAAVTAAHLGRLLARGIAALKKGADLFSADDLDYRIPVEGDDELADLGRQFNAMAERLKLSYRSIEAANRELEGFTYSVSHDLRTPLRHIAGFSEMLQRRNPEGLDDKSRHYLDVICAGATQMGRLIDDLLAFSRTGKAELRRQPVRLDELVAGVVGDLEPETAGRSVEWRIAPLPTVIGDEAMIRLAVANLLSNAIKFTSGRPHAIIEVESRVEGNEVVVSVRDNGAGFDMQYGGKLFGLFQRLHPVESFPGTGMGLANVRRIIHRHGGRTWAEGRVGEGAAFHFSLPIQSGGAAP